MNLEKAKLVELDDKLEHPKPRGKVVEVQFNPESLKVSYSNQIANKAQGGAQDQSAGPAGRQYVGSGTTKMSLQLWFDAKVTKNNISDENVRRMTAEVVYFITPQGDGDKKLPPGVRFHWGNFIFDGVVDSLEETLEFFSREGNPLRASVSLGLSQEKILISAIESNRVASRGAPGTQAMVSVLDGDNLPSLANAKNKSTDWFQLAEANGIENPRQLIAGQLLNLNSRR